MSSIYVHFIYLTGIRQPLFTNARLVGNWGSSDWALDDWASVPMRSLTGPDGCPSFLVRVEFEEGQIGRSFRWGVRLDGPAGPDCWGVTIGELWPDSSRPERSFRLEPSSAGENVQEEVFYLNQSRRLGAQKLFRHPTTPGQPPGIQFAVWAPNASDVSICIGNLWSDTDPTRSSVVDPARPDPETGRALQSLPHGQFGGGYIAADGAGSHSTWGPFPARRQLDEVWVTNPDDPSLDDFRRFDHVPYMLRITKDDGTVAYRTDLYSRCQIGSGNVRPNGAYWGRTQALDGSLSCSVVVDPDRVATRFRESVWPEREWTPQAEFFPDPPPPRQPAAFQDLVIYELHIGALGAATRPSNEPGTIEDAVAMLDYLVDLGVNALELLPLSEFGGSVAGWGYATSHYFAIEYSGGGRDQFKHFIRECHRRGIAVIMDVVYNHYCHEAERAEWMFDTNVHGRNPYYWYEGRPEDYDDFNRKVEPERHGTGGYVDNMSTGWAPRYWEEPVRAMFISSAIALVMEFQIDGFRVDQTTSIHALNKLHANGNRLENVNDWGCRFLREFTRTLRLIKPDILLSAEDHSNWAGVLGGTDSGGLGFDATWYVDFYHHLVGDTDKGADYAKLLRTAGLGDDRPLAMGLFGAALQATSGGRKVVYHESHDEAGNGRYTDRTLRVAVNGAPLIGATRRYAEARCRFVAGVTFLSAGIPLFLFGEEVGVERKFLYGHVLEDREDLNALRNSLGANLFRYYADLIRLRRSRSGLRSGEIDVLFTHDENRLIVFRRWAEGEEYLIVGSLNNRPFDEPTYVFFADRIPGASWREVFNSDADVYGGSNTGNGGRTIEVSHGRFECTVPANGVLVFERTV